MALICGLLGSLSLSGGPPSFVLSRSARYRGGTPTTTRAAAAADGGSEEKWFANQTLDHSTNNQRRAASVWRQRYFEDLSLWRGPGSPVFLEMGGEGPAGGAPGGLQRQLAKQHGAALLTLEHRFYGASWPHPDMSAAHLRDLSSEQALGDAAQFIQWWEEQHEGALGRTAWLAWGGSYSGQLAAWLRLRYPSSVLGAVAFSAPVHAQLDFYQYNQVATAAVAALGGQACTSLLEAAFAAAVAQLGEGGAARRRAAATLQACDPVLGDDDASTLQGSVQGAIQSLVQYNQAGGKRGIGAFCGIGANASAAGAAPLEALGKMLDFAEGGRCLVSNFTALMAPLRDTNFTTGTPTSRQWYYQLCNEFGQQTCEPGATDCAAGVAPLPKPSMFAPFALPGDLAGGLALCADLYNITATPPAHWSGHQRGWVNVAHGGTHLSVPNVVFVNGRKDPYSSVSLLPEQLSAAQAHIGMQSVAVVNGSHCVGMDAAGPSDSPELAVAKATVAKAVAAWLDARNGAAV